MIICPICGNVTKFSNADFIHFTCDICGCELEAPNYFEVDSRRRKGISRAFAEVWRRFQVWGLM